jgi:DNA-binding GntR family transcriptional regulator
MALNRLELSILIPAHVAGARLLRESMNAQPPHRTLRSWVYETLRERIVAGELAPGEALVEAQLAQDMGISRSPIREALRQLGQDGLVVTQPNSATIVSTVDEFDVDQVFEIRDLLESCLIAHAAIARTDIELAECDSILAQMPGVAEAEDLRRYAELDVQFHSALWNMAKRPMVTETIRPIVNQARRYLSLSSRTLRSDSVDTLLESYHEHVRMLAAVEDCNVAEAVAATRIHMSSSRKRILQNMEVGREEAAGKPSHRMIPPLAYTISWTEGEL